MAKGGPAISGQAEAQRRRYRCKERYAELPPGALAGQASAVLAAVIIQGRPTVRGTAKLAGYSVGQVHVILRQLRELGLVSWSEGKAGTLRAACCYTGIARLAAAA